MDKKIDSVIFDLDGTLWDTCASCAIAWNNVLDRNKIPFRTITDLDVRKVTGKPHEICIRETFIGLPEPQIKVLINETMIEDNSVIEKIGANLYAGVLEGLGKLSKHYPLCIVSNCQSGYIEIFLKFSGLTDLFLDFECWGNTGKSKAENLNSVISRNSLKYPIMVGDMESDLIAAQKCEIPFIHMTYGFGKVMERDLEFSNFNVLYVTLNTAEYVYK